MKFWIIRNCEPFLKYSTTVFNHCFDTIGEMWMFNTVAIYVRRLPYEARQWLGGIRSCTTISECSLIWKICCTLTSTSLRISRIKWRQKFWWVQPSFNSFLINVSRWAAWNMPHFTLRREHFCRDHQPETPSFHCSNLQMFRDVKVNSNSDCHPSSICIWGLCANHTFIVISVSINQYTWVAALTGRVTYNDSHSAIVKICIHTSSWQIISVRYYPQKELWACQVCTTASDAALANLINAGLLIAINLYFWVERMCSLICYEPPADTDIQLTWFCGSTNPSNPE